MTAEAHEHTWIVGPHSKVEGRRKFSHSHEAPVRAHHHPCTGPGKFAMQSRLAKFTAKPKGEQFRYIAATPVEQTFDFVFADVYTDGHVEAGIPREEWEATRAQVVAEIAGEPIPPMPVITGRRTGHGVHVVNRGGGAAPQTEGWMYPAFGLTAVPRIAPPGCMFCGKPREDHPQTKGGWTCPEWHEADRQRRERDQARYDAELAEMGWTA